MDIIGRKRQQDENFKAIEKENEKKRRLDSLHKAHSHFEKVNKAKSDLSLRMNQHLSVQEKKDLSTKQQQELNNRELEAALQRKKEKDLAIKRQVELSNKMLADK